MVKEEGQNINPLIIDSVLTFEDHMQMAKYKENYFSNDLIVPPEITYAWYLYNPDTFTAARNTLTGKIVGHMNCLPVTNELVEKVVSGNLDDYVFSVSFLKESSNIIRKYSEPGEYVLYLCSIAVHPEYLNTGLFKRLLNAYGEIILRLAETGIYISTIVANAVTQVGSEMCKYSGMKAGVITGNNNIHISTAPTDFLNSFSDPLRSKIVGLYSGVTPINSLRY